MMDDIDHFSEFTLHVILATFPQSQEAHFGSSVRKKFYGRYRESCKDYLAQPNEGYGIVDGTPILYNPLSYVILGNYDIAYLALIDNFKFAQRLFEPELSDKPEVKLFGPHTFQSFTGITHESTKRLTDFFSEHLKPAQPVRKTFLGICNLKLNNGFLVGNGKRYLNHVLQMIDRVISEDGSVEYLKLQSFSWFEISLIMFADDAQSIATRIQKLRRLTIEEMGESASDIIKDSLYKSYFQDKDLDFFKYANIFADTHTYFGIHADVFDVNSDYYDSINKEKLKLSAECEWQVKPGHMHLLSKQLFELGIVLDEPKDDDKKFLVGRTDYCIKNHLDDLGQVIQLMRTMMKPQSKLYDHVRKLRTNIYFGGLEGRTHPKDSVISFQEKLTPLAEIAETVGTVNKQLKALKVSRQIRSKVLKIFSNFNNGIQDIVLFPYLLDFKIFTERMKIAIKEAHTNFEKHCGNPLFDSTEDRYEDDGYLHQAKLEDILMKMIEIFEEGFSIRMLNPYQFEDINDFDLDFNSAIQQLLSVYSTVAFEIGNLIYKERYSYGPVIQLNLKDTVSNASSINYYVHHLTSPEFVFATITKEIINALPEDDKDLKALLDTYVEKKYILIKRNPIFHDLEDRKLLYIDYFFNDALRYVWTYHMDFDLFFYWFWTYNFQNASLYNEIGLLDESHFEKELFRILFIAKYFLVRTSKGEFIDNANKVICPLPELESYWDRHYEKIAVAVTDFIEFLVEEGISLNLTNYLETKLMTIMTKGKMNIDKIPLETGSVTADFVANLEARHSGKTVNLGDKFKTLLRGRLKMFAPEHDVKPPDWVITDSVDYLEWYICHYLNQIYQMNGKKISLLRRNWRNGKPMIAFVDGNPPDHLYSVDQTGGLFFEHTESQNLYFKHTSKTLTDLWHFSLVRKLEFINFKNNAPKV